MGRHLKRESTGSIIGFKVINKASVDMLKTISLREGVELGIIYNRAIDEYAEKHGKGNYQTLIGSFAEGGVQSDGQIEQSIIVKLRYENPQKEIKFKYLLDVCRDFGFEKDAAEHANTISRLLIKEVWKVWR